MVGFVLSVYPQTIVVAIFLISGLSYMLGKWNLLRGEHRNLNLSCLHLSLFLSQFLLLGSYLLHLLKQGHFWRLDTLLLLISYPVLKLGSLELFARPSAVGRRSTADDKVSITLKISPIAAITSQS
jgi:hypothetical protein